MDKKNAFTLVEVLIVIAILGLLAGIAVPNVMKARDAGWENACKGNMAIIEAAIEQWALDKHKTGTTDITTTTSKAGWVSYIKGGLPHCPKPSSTSGAYTYGGNTPTLNNYTVTCPSGHLQ